MACRLLVLEDRSAAWILVAIMVLFAPRSAGTTTTQIHRETNGSCRVSQKESVAVMIREVPCLDIAHDPSVSTRTGGGG